MSNEEQISEEELLKYVKGLAEIRRHRETDQKNFKYFAIPWLIVCILAKAYPPLAFVSIGIAVMWFYTFFLTAAIPCPRCNEPFITRWAMPVIGNKTKECQNCKLSFDILTKYENNPPESDTKE